MAEGQQNKGKGQYFARLENQKQQLERHGNFAEVVIRTTPEGTDLINFARLWEHVLVMGDRSTRGYMAKKSREDFDKTRNDFDECIEFMIGKLQDCIERHEIDLQGSNFISRVSQRYKITDKRKPNKKELEAAKAKRDEAKEASAESTIAEESVVASHQETKSEPAKKPAEKQESPVKKSALEDNVEGF